MREMEQEKLERQKREGWVREMQREVGTGKRKGKGKRIGTAKKNDRKI